jgi:CO/xanthine dehydrogenase Mo-binding subunit
MIQSTLGSMTEQARESGTSRKIIGGSNLRIDSLGKVTGRTRYVEDMNMPGLLHAQVLRSPHHHARLLALDCRRASELPGVVQIITAGDIPGLNGLDGYSREDPVLTPVGDTVRQRGAPVAIVLAESPSAAQNAAAAIEVTYELLPHTFAADAALSVDAVQIYPAGNVLSNFEVKHGDLEAAFAASDVIIEADYRTTFQEHSTLEREATLAYLEADGRVTVLGGTHEPHWQVDYIAQTLGVDPLMVRVILPPTGGSFGSRQDPWPLVAAGLAAYLARRPVRLAYTRREVFDATPKRHPYHVRHRIGATGSGRLTGVHVRVDCNTGGYDSGGYWIPNYAVTASGGAYRWQAVDAKARAIYTNAAKCGQFRGYGSPQSTFALECALDELCQRLNADPLEFRLANQLRQEDISFLGYPVGESLGYGQALEAIRPRYHEFLQEAAAFNESHAHDSSARGQPRLRMSVGLAGMWYRFGKSGCLRVETHAELAADGHVIVYCSAPDYGQGINTVMVQLAAETFGLPRGQIELVNADTALTPDSGIQGASRATYFIGHSLCQAVENLREEVLGIAAELLDRPPADLRPEGNAIVSCARGGSVSLREVAQEFDRIGKSRRVVGIFDLSPQFPSFDPTNEHEYVPLFVTGAQAAQVSVDMETGLAQVRRIVAAHDVGRAINPPNAIGQIEGAVMMGIGTALTESYVPGVTTGFTDYILPMIGAVPEMEVILVEVPSYYGPLGVKGLGEAAIMPTAPAVINGLSRAIGVRLRELPASPPRVLEAIRAGQGLNR